MTKDALEDRLHWLMISGRLDLKQAQKEISADWTAAYRKYVGEFPAYRIGCAIALEFRSNVCVVKDSETIPQSVEEVVGANNLA